MEKNYPPGALQRGEQGSVGFEVSVEPDGFMSACRVMKSSGFPTLDRETCLFLAMHAKFPAVKTTGGDSVRAVHQGSINWKLPGSARAAAAAKASPENVRLELICKRFRKTGSKIAYVRQCLTETEWALKSSILQDEVRRLQDPGGVIPSARCDPRC